MDAQELRNLQESYMKVVENQQLDEAKREEDEEDWRKSEIRNYRRHKLTGTTTPYTDRIVSHNKNRGVKKVKGVKVREDIYDIILSHLLDEGYANTESSALAIMVNMSEDWKQSIIKETKRTQYLQKKFDKENAMKSGSAHTYIPGKQNTGAALHQARTSERQMRGEK